MPDVTASCDELPYDSVAHKIDEPFFIYDKIFDF